MPDITPSPARNLPDPDPRPDLPPSGRTAAVDRIKPLFLFVLAALVVLVALGASVFYVFTQEGRDRDTYVVVVVLLFFALSTASSLLFTNASTIRADLKALTISVIGPAALWLSGIALFFYLLPPQELFDDSLQRPNTTADIGRIVNDVEQRHGWLDYGAWKEKQTTVSDLFDEQEYGTFRDLLSSVVEPRYFDRVDSARIATVFVYLPDSVVKFQRIQGRREGENAHIRFKSRGTDGAAKARSAFFVADARNGDVPRLTESFTDVTTKGKKGIEEISSDPVDCLIVTLYDDPVDEDYLVINPGRFSNSEITEVDLAALDLVPGKSIVEANVWAVKSPLFMPDRNASPLLFQRLGTAGTDAGHFHKAIFPWLDSLESALQHQQVKDARARELLLEIRAKFRDASGREDLSLGGIHDLLKGEALSGFHSDDARYTVMMLLRRR